MDYDDIGSVRKAEPGRLVILSLPPPCSEKLHHVVVRTRWKPLVLTYVQQDLHNIAVITKDCFQNPVALHLMEVNTDPTTFILLGRQKYV